jgi:hypothetical protein
MKSGAGEREGDRWESDKEFDVEEEMEPGEALEEGGEDDGKEAGGFGDEEASETKAGD